MMLRMRVHDKEPIGLALRRFKKLIERSGMQKELRSRQHYEKPCELRRRALIRKQRAGGRTKSKCPGERGYEQPPPPRGTVGVFRFLVYFSGPTSTRSG